MRKVLVTGGAGFIGRSVVSELLGRGDQAVIYDRPQDVLSISDLALAMRNQFGVIHLAGMLGTHELFDRVPDAVDVNVKGTAHVLRAARREGAAYVGITMPAVFPSIYTATKIAAAGLERAFHHEGLSVSRVRAFNAYGIGQKHGPFHPRKIVPTFATEAWAGRPIPIWGDGEQTVDLIDTAQLARLLVDALDFGDDITLDGGTGLPHTVNEVAQMVLEITGSLAGVKHLPMRRGEVPTRIVAAGEGWERLDWKPAFDGPSFASAVESYR